MGDPAAATRSEEDGGLGTLIRGLSERDCRNGELPDIGRREKAVFAGGFLLYLFTCCFNFLVSCYNAT